VPRLKTQQSCHAWTVLRPGSFVVGREFIFGFGPWWLRLLAVLYAVTGTHDTFKVAEEIADVLRWKPARLAEARRQLVRYGYLEIAKQYRRKKLVVYRWRCSIQTYGWVRSRTALRAPKPRPQPVMRAVAGCLRLDRRRVKAGSISRSCSGSSADGCGVNGSGAAATACEPRPRAQRCARPSPPDQT
jgi:hypothetical protein